MAGSLLIRRVQHPPHVPTASFAASMRSTGVGDNPVWVERMKEGWETEILALLDTLFNGTWTQKVIFSEIKARCELKKFEVLIFPRVYRPEKLPSKGVDEGEVVNLYMNSVTSGPVSLDGENAFIYFDPARGGPMASFASSLRYQPWPFGGVGMEPGDNLFHELVHAQRRLKGIRDRTRPSRRLITASKNLLPSCSPTSPSTSRTVPGAALLRDHFHAHAAAIQDV